MEMFKSTMKRKWVNYNGVYKLEPEEYPYWYGIEGIGFIFQNCWADPLIEYKGKQFSCFYVEDAMWEEFREDHPHGTEEEFDQYMRDNKDEVYELCENIVNYTEEEAV